VVAAYRYAPPLDRLIQGAKYNGRLDWIELCSRELAERLRGATGGVQALVPVPLHRTRLRERGYNQSLELARPLGRRFGLRVLTAGIRRLRPTLPQTGLSRELREKNVRRAFAVDCPLDGLHLAIVDDVMTSGATIEAFARALRRAGAADVEAWVVARAG
jgi:ComF family protein